MERTTRDGLSHDKYFLRSHADVVPVIGKADVVTSTWIEREQVLRQKAVSKKFILPRHGDEQ
jgi:predicted transcriptional regulator